MPINDIFSKRQKREQGRVLDAYQYNTIPQALRIQVTTIMNDVCDKIIEDTDANNRVFVDIHEVLCREYGMITLDADEENSDSSRNSVMSLLLKTDETEKAINVIELFFQKIKHHLPRNRRDNFINRENSPDHPLDIENKRRLHREAINELNHRFREHGVGYQYDCDSNKMIPLDSPFIHDNVVCPTLNLLSDSMYDGANAEFLSAYQHYQAKQYKECLNDCLKAFESCLKAICEMREWKYNEDATAKNLIDIVFNQKLIPDFMQSHFTGLRTTLQAGLPSIRNRMSAHGQGRRKVQVPEHIVTYALHLTASNILFLTRANKSMESASG